MKTGADAVLLQLIALPPLVRKGIVFAGDVVLCIISVWIAYSLRLGEWQLFSPGVIVFGAITVATWSVVALLTRTYRSVVRFSGRHTVAGLLRACVLMSVVLVGILLVWQVYAIPRTLAVIHPLIFFLLLAIQRLAISQLLIEALHGWSRIARPKHVLIYGAGWAGQQLAVSMRQEPNLKVVGFIDQNDGLRKQVLEGKMIWHIGDLERVLASEAVDEVFLAMPSAKRSVRRAIVERIRQVNSRIRVRVLPTVSEIALGKVSVSDLREVQIEELLGRDEVPPDPVLMSRNITSRRVIVTGAGGSIGSELCRQILRQRPGLLILAEQSEHALYMIDSELREIQKREGLDSPIEAELVNVAEEGQCERLFMRLRPDTVFHAAAYKHVPLVELNPVAGIRNNVFGTLHASLAAEKAGAGKFILVSTDKSVRPTNIMGASKRICELITQARAQAQAHTRYTSVRFGNVLGSSGSVIPRFREQIAAGGPVTITHKEAARYFMTIPEAAQLVIQAGALADEGEILLLDMGRPVLISDLANAMVELSGLTVLDDENPDGDIAIVEVGLRPGEKLIEELLIDAASEITAHPRIIKARESMLKWQELEPELSELKRLLATAEVGSAIAAVRRLVPEYQPHHRSSVEINGDTITPLRAVGGRYPS